MAFSVICVYLRLVPSAVGLWAGYSRGAPRETDQTDVPPAARMVPSAVEPGAAPPDLTPHYLQTATFFEECGGPLAWHFPICKLANLLEQETRGEGHGLMA